MKNVFLFLSVFILSNFASATIDPRQWLLEVCPSCRFSNSGEVEFSGGLVARPYKVKGRDIELTFFFIHSQGYSRQPYNADSGERQAEIRRICGELNLSPKNVSYQSFMGVQTIHVLTCSRSRSTGSTPLRGPGLINIPATNLNINEQMEIPVNINTSDRASDAGTVFENREQRTTLPHNDSSLRQ